MEKVSYKNRAKNVVFIFGDDPMPEREDVYKVALEPQREVIRIWVGSHSLMRAIYDAIPMAYQHFVTKSAPQETLDFLNPVIL